MKNTWFFLYIFLKEQKQINWKLEDVEEFSSGSKSCFFLELFRSYQTHHESIS